MLNHLQIRDFAIIEHLDLDLSPGMTAVTGETGAGKSIMVDALALLLGDRADNSTIRHGAERTEISAVFDLAHLPLAQAWLAEHDLSDAVQDCHLRRVISHKGRSRAYIGGSLQPLQSLKELGQLLVDIHGQHEHQSLLRREQQRQLVDDYADNQALLLELIQHYRHWNQLQKTLDHLRQTSHEREARLDLLRYQVQELQALDLQNNELTELEEEHGRLANASRLLESCQRLLDNLYEHESVSAHHFLSQGLQELQTLQELDNRLAATGEMMNAALIQVEEASMELRRYLRDLELDPQRLIWVEERLAAIQTLARKHRILPEELPALLERLNHELEDIDNRELHQEHLEQQLTQARQAYSNCAETLGERRAKAATELGVRVSEAMQGLGMPGGQFVIQVEHQTKFSPSGLETVEFLVSANPGQPLRPLTKVASGGELSRISLAIQVIAAHSATIPTLIFDEVDVGIGGAIAEVVGRLLRTLGQNRQVLCVTHLPQVAAQAHHHFKIDKRIAGQSTRTVIERLLEDTRVEEIARMLGGLAVTDKTRLHAREMIETSCQQQTVG